MGGELREKYREKNNVKKRCHQQWGNCNRRAIII
jgi:hypothetical protein